MNSRVSISVAPNFVALTKWYVAECRSTMIMRNIALKQKRGMIRIRSGNYILRYDSGLVVHLGRVDIIASILRTIISGIKDSTKTNIGYNTFLSHSQITKYMPILLANQLVTYHNGSRIYRVTRRGIGFLQLYDKMTGMLDKPA